MPKSTISGPVFRSRAIVLTFIHQWIVLYSAFVFLFITSCFYQQEFRDNPLDPLAPSYIPARTWKLARASGDFSPRSGHALIVFGNELWMLGGYDGTTYRNDIFRSSDGIAWNMMGNAPFNGRADFGYTVFNGKIWVVGGQTNGGIAKDVWCSADGITWVQPSSSGLPPLRGCAVVPKNGAMWLFAGETNTGMYTNGVWSSIDGTSATSHGTSISARALFGYALHNDSIWVLCGYNGSYIADVWKTDTTTTAQVPAITNAHIAPRSRFNAASFNGQIIVVGGEIAVSTFTNDVFRSPDGTNWYLVTNAPFSPRGGYGMAVFKGKLWLIGGQTNGGGYANDIWYAY
ncbi:MAG: hypothetical protein AABZ39_18055 [Spirochaetota bacterium]